MGKTRHRLRADDERFARQSFVREAVLASPQREKADDPKAAR